MALFGSDLVDVTTPDGRRITVPQQLAAQFPGLRPVPPEVAQPPALPVAPPVPAFTPEDQADIAQRTAPPPDTAAAAPVTAPSQVEPSGPQAPRGPVATPAQATDAGQANTPAPITNDQLAKMGVAGGVNAELAANDAQRAAVKQQGAALANQAEKVGAAMAASEAEAGRLLEQRRAAAEENARMMQTRTDEYLRNAKAIADTKIDRSVDHPVLAAIGVALGAIGGAMMQKQYGGQLTNPGLDALYKAIDRKAAAQVQDLELKRQGLATQRDALGMQRQAGIDRLQEMDTYRLGYLEQAKRQVETIKQQTTSDVVRANADVALAGLDQEAAKTVSGAQARWQTQHDAELARKQTLQIAQMSNATQIRGQNMEQKRFDDRLSFDKAKEVDEIATKIALAKGANKDAVAKRVSEQGIVDPVTRKLMLTAAGNKKLADADAIEAQLRRDPTGPAQAYVRKLKQDATTDEAKTKADQLAAQIASDPNVARQAAQAYADGMRDDARTNDVALALNKGGAEDAQKVLKNTTSLINDISTAKQMLEQGPEAWNREDWSGLTVALQNVKINYASTIGERLSVRAIDALKDVLTLDPDSLAQRTLNKGKALAALKVLNDEMVQKANVALGSAGVETSWNPGGATKAEPLALGKTAQELGSDAEPGLLSNTAATIKDATGAILHPIDAASPDSGYFRGDPTVDAENAANARTNAKGQASSYGLAPETDDKIRELVSQSAKVGHSKYADIIGKLKAPLEGDRPSLAIGTARLIRDTDPKLFADVMQSLPEMKRAEIQQAIAPPRLTGDLPKRSLADLDPEERAAFEAQRAARVTEDERRKYREAYDKRAAQGTRP